MEDTQKMKDNNIDECDKDGEDIDSNNENEQSVKFTNGSNKHKSIDQEEKDQELVGDDSKNQMEYNKKEYLVKLQVS